MLCSFFSDFKSIKAICEYFFL